MNQRKSLVQKLVRENFNVHVDQPLAGGAGNTNTGNVARKLLSNPELMAKTLGLDETFLRRLQIVLIAVSCHQTVDHEKISEFLP